MLKQDIIKLYILLRKYRDHTKAMLLTADHYHYRVQDLMSKQEFFDKVTSLINKELANKSGGK